MSITDSSTALNTSWTENTVVAFTAGTLATITDCITEVQSKLKRGTLSTASTPTLADAQRWLIRAKQELAEIKGFDWRRRYAYATLSVSDYRISLPPDFDGGMVRIKDTTNDQFIELHDPHHFDSIYPDLSAEENDKPLHGCIKGRELWIAPPVSSAVTFEIEYDRSGDDNTATDFSWLPEIERFRCCDFAIGEAFESLHMWEASDRFKAKWGTGAGKAIRADGRRKWKTMNYRARSWQEQHDNLSYQPGNT